MKLSTEQVKLLTRGYAYVTEDETGIAFHRFTEKAEKYYLETSPNDFYVKTAADSGICFDFVTDSDSFEFTYTAAVASSRRFYYFDAYIDGVMTMHVGEAEMWINRGTVKVAIPAGRHRVTVWLPCLTACELSDFILDDDASFEPTKPACRMLCFGDSISQGYDAKFPSFSYTNQLARHFDAYMINQAIGGEKFVPGILDETFAKAFVPDIITVAYGTNDWSGFPKELFEERCDAFQKGLAELYPTSKIYIITPLWRADKDRITKVGTFEEATEYIVKIAKKYGHNVIDGVPLTPHVTDFYSDLRLHPNDFGFCEYAKNLIKELEK